jgi:histidine triad (HIT) family protein
MKSHAPKNYVCPICLAVEGIENDQTLIKQQDILYKDEDVMVFISSFFIEGAEGQPLISPIRHYENFYDIPDTLGAKIFKISKEYAVKMKNAYNCDGVNILQNNEPAAGQHAFHYHLHLFPRYEGKDIWPKMGRKKLASMEERLEFVKKFKQ